MKRRQDGRALVKTLLNVTGFQLGWLACVLGSNLIGAAVVTLVLTAHLRWLAQPGEWRWLIGPLMAIVTICLGLGVQSLNVNSRLGPNAWRFHAPWGP